MAFPRTGPLVVVKLGGSHATDRARLGAIVGEIVTASARVVVVPGGGPFADAVRTVQASLGASDALAHRQALGAMGLFAEMLADVHPPLVMAATRAELDAAHAAGRVPVFRPDRLASGGGGLEAGWHVTSDTVAAWLAFELSASGLVLVKSADGPDLAGARRLADLGLVDAAFPVHAGRLACPVRLVGPSALDRLGDLLAAPDGRIGTVVAG